MEEVLGPADLQVLWTASASCYSEASLPRATFPLISDRPDPPQAFSSIQSVVLPKRQGPPRRAHETLYLMLLWAQT